MKTRSLLTVGLAVTCFFLFPLQLVESGVSTTGPVIVTVEDGSSFEGTLRKTTRDALIFATSFGERRVEKESVVAQKSSTELRDRYKKKRQGIAEKDVEGHLKLARWCRTQGLTSGLDEELEIVLKRDPARSGAWEMLRSDAPHYQLAKKNPHSRQKRARWERAQVDLLFAAIKRKKTDFVRAGLVKVQLSALPIELQVTAAIQKAERGTKYQRWVGVQQLGETKNVRRVKTLYRVALTDQTWQVRRMAVHSLKLQDDGSTFRPFVKALVKHPNIAARMNAAQALGFLGDKRAVAPLVRALKRAGEGRVAHSNISSINQIAYVKDYDVEVAQTAFIADPLVDIVLDGLVLDIGLVSASAQRRVYGRALSRLTGADFGEHRKPWLNWWRANKSKFGHHG